MKSFFISLVALCLIFASCSTSNYESTQFGGLTIEHPKKELQEYANCNIPALGNHFSNLMQQQGLQSLTIRVKGTSSAIFIYFPVQQQVIGTTEFDKEFAAAVASIKKKVYDNQQEVFMFLCDDMLNGLKLIGDCGLLVYENGKKLDVTQVEVSKGYVMDCWQNKLFYKDYAGRTKDEAGEGLYYVIPESICFSGYKDYKNSIYTANAESLFEFILADISVEGYKHPQHLCLSYYFNAGPKDYLAGVKVNGVDVKQTQKQGARQCFKLTSVTRLFEDELMVTFTQKPSEKEFKFKLTVSELNEIKEGLYTVKDGEIIANPKTLGAEYTIAYQETEIEDENTGEMKKILVLTYVSEQM